jgi:hypothetical protein
MLEFWNGALWIWAKSTTRRRARDDSAPSATYRSSYMLTARRIPGFLSARVSYDA